MNCLDFSMSGEKFASVGRDLDVRIYDSESHQVHVLVLQQQFVMLQLCNKKAGACFKWQMGRSQLFF